MKTTKGEPRPDTKDELIYVAGAMSNKPFFNFPLFDRAVEAINAMPGRQAVPPADLNDPEIRALALASPEGKVGTASPNGETWGDFLAEDVKIVADRVDSLALIPDWEDSSGAPLEAMTAYMSRKKVYLLNNDFTELHRFYFVSFLRRMIAVAIRNQAREVHGG